MVMVEEYCFQTLCSILTNYIQIKHGLGSNNGKTEIQEKKDDLFGVDGEEVPVEDHGAEL
jgi:hypothetical protein